MMRWCVADVAQQKAQPVGGNGGTCRTITDFVAASALNAMTRLHTMPTATLRTLENTC